MLEASIINEDDLVDAGKRLEEHAKNANGSRRRGCGGSNNGPPNHSWNKSGAGAANLR